MSPSTDAPVDALRGLIADLNGDDPNLARAALKRYEPFLRMVVRRQLRGTLRSQLDSMDVVQSIWADLLGADAQEHWRFRDPAQLRAFLARVARNRLINHRRGQERSADVRPLDSLLPEDSPCGRGPRPSEVARGHELWDRLLAACPEDHREILRLRLQGFTLAEIAARRGLHEGSVRRILYTLAKTIPLDAS
jgi:RNA polymerase sigma-70 factor (ECF subfamily)